MRLHARFLPACGPHDYDPSAGPALPGRSHLMLFQKTKSLTEDRTAHSVALDQLILRAQNLCDRPAHFDDLTLDVLRYLDGEPFYARLTPRPPRWTAGVGFADETQDISR